MQRALTLGLLALMACSDATDPDPDPDPTPTPSQTGTLTVWAHTSAGTNIQVRLAGTTIGTITQTHTVAPSCGAAGAVTVTRPGGSYAMTASSATGTWSGTVTVTAGTCTLIELYQDDDGGGNGEQCGPLTGSWVRQGNQGMPGANNLVVTWQGTTGVVTSNPGGSVFTVGTLKWRNYNQTNCTIEDLTRSTDGNTANDQFNTWTVTMTGDQLDITGTKYARQ